MRSRDALALLLICGGCPTRADTIVLNPDRIYISIKVPFDVPHPTTDGQLESSASGSGINNAGDVVGRSSDLTNDHGFLYSNGTYTKIDYPAPTPTYGGSEALGINNTGQILGRFFDLNTGGQLAFIKTGSQFTPITGPGPIFPTGLNDQGQVVGLSDSDNTYSPFLWQNGVLTVLPSGPGSSFAPTAINDSGQIVGNVRSQDGLGTEPSLYANGSFHQLDISKFGNYGRASGINNKGQIVGTVFNVEMVNTFLVQTAISR